VCIAEEFILLLVLLLLLLLVLLRALAYPGVTAERIEEENIFLLLGYYLLSSEAD
jgi:hypothetical protein